MGLGAGAFLLFSLCIHSMASMGFWNGFKRLHFTTELFAKNKGRFVDDICHQMAILAIITNLIPPQLSEYIVYHGDIISLKVSSGKNGIF